MFGVATPSKHQFNSSMSGSLRLAPIIVHVSTGEPCGFCMLSVNSNTANPTTVSHCYKSDALPGDAKVP